MLKTEVFIVITRIKTLMRTFRILYIIIFFAILSLPLIGLIWYKEPAVSENKVLATVPRLFTEHGLNSMFLQDAEDYYSDHFAYRQELVTANALLKSKVFSVSAEPLAVTGTDGWSYLSVTLDDYRRLKPISERALYAASRTLYLMQEYTENLGGSFVFASAPNKNTLYPEHMPYYLLKGEGESNLSRLTPYLDKADVNYVDLYERFDSDERVLYHKGDSHWDNRGAAMVQDALLNACGKEHTDFTALSYTERNDFVGDIDKILYPLATHPETEYDFGRYQNFQFVNTEDVTANKIETANPEKTGSLLCFRDSFGNSLLPFLAQDFNKGFFLKEVPYRLDYMSLYNADTVIVELVERNLNHLLMQAPVFSAPLRQPDLSNAEIVTECDSQIRIEQFENYHKLYGICDSRYISDEGRICLRLSNEENTFIVEATPADEYHELGKGGEYGFVAYIGLNSFPKGEYKVEILSETMYTYIYDTNATIIF